MKRSGSIGRESRRVQRWAFVRALRLIAGLAFLLLPVNAAAQSFTGEARAYLVGGAWVQRGTDPTTGAVVEGSTRYMGDGSCTVSGSIQSGGRTTQLPTAACTWSAQTNAGRIQLNYTMTVNGQSRQQTDIIEVVDANTMRTVVVGGRSATGEYNTHRRVW